MMLRGLLSAMHASGGDPYWSSVVLLALNDNAANNSTSFADQSGSNHTLTAVANAAYSSAQAPTGMTTSALFGVASSDDGVSSADHVDWSLGSGYFTIEGMVRFTHNSRYGTLAAQYASVTSDASWWLTLPQPGSDNNVYWEWTTNGVTNNFESFPWTPSLDTWYHVAVTRSGTDLKVFIDGTQIGTTKTNSATIFNSTYIMEIGRTANVPSYSMRGYIACVRITKGVARYTATFTPPSLPLPTS